MNFVLGSFVLAGVSLVLCLAPAARCVQRLHIRGWGCGATSNAACTSCTHLAGVITLCLCSLNSTPKQDMVRRGCERNVITYSSLISACEKAGRWELALELFREMHTEVGVLAAGLVMSYLAGVLCPACRPSCAKRCSRLLGMAWRAWPASWA